MAQDRDRVDRFLPLKPFVLDVLLELADGKRHGWSLIRDIQQRDGGDRILPANFYRTLRALRDDGLIEEAKGDANEDPAERRQYFSLTLAWREGRARRGQAPRGAGRRSAGAETAEGSLTMKASRSFYRLLLRLCPPDLRARVRRRDGSAVPAVAAARARRRQSCACGRARSPTCFVTASARGGQLATSSGRPRRTSSTNSGGWWMDTLRYDLRHAIRAMCAPTGHQPDHRADAGARDRRQHRGVLRGPHRADPAAAVRRSPIRS